MNTTFFKISGILSFCFAITATPAFAQEHTKTQNVGNGVYELAIDHEDNIVYVASIGHRGADNAQIYFLDGQTLQAVDSMQLEEGAFGLGYNQKTKTLYTSNTRSNSVYAIDVRNKKVLATISNGREESHTRELVIDEDNNLIYVSDVGEPSTVWVIDGKTNQYLYSLEEVGTYATGLALDGKGKTLYVTLMGEGKVVGIDVKSGKKNFEVMIDTAASPINIVLDEEKELLYVSDSKLNKVYAIHIRDRKIQKSIDVGTYPIGIELDRVNNRIYTANREGQSVSVIDRSTLTFLRHVPTGALSNTIRTNPSTGISYVTNKQVSLVNRKGEPTGNEALTNGDSVSKIEG